MTPAAAIGRGRAQAPVIAVALAALAVVAIGAGSPRLAVAAGLGFVAGLALHRSRFGFAAAWRRAVLDGRMDGVRAQLAMLAIAVIGFYPLLGAGWFAGERLYGFVEPVGVALVLGAFLFGIGMQLGGGCGSGTLYTAGGGSTRMLVTLAAFVAGSLAATADPLSWTRWPQLGRWSVIEAWGSLPALAAVLALLAALGIAARRYERRRTGRCLPIGAAADGNWPLLAGAAALAMVNVGTLLALGRPWGITSAFALWGAKLAAGLGVEVAGWDWWHDGTTLAAGFLDDPTSVMDIALIAGALCAAGIGGTFAPTLRIGGRSLAAAVLGGVLMGVGARMSTGCNIGAFFSGIASGSLHGVIWAMAAIPGTVVGIRLRRELGLGRS